MRVLIAIYFASLLVAAPQPQSTPCPDLSAAVNWFQKVHAQWQDLGPENIATLLDSPVLSITYVPSSPASGANTSACTGSIELTNETRMPTCFIRAVFDRVTTAKTCHSPLRSFAFRTTLPLGDAMALLTRIQVALKAGGKPEGNEWDQTYTWRSKDSTTATELVTAIMEVPANANPDTPVTLLIRLRHTAADPSNVDKLPFERGVFFKR
jgi:hypothetical protein